VTLTEWSNLIFRWIHLIAGIWWIGSSLYFIWLDRNFAPLSRPRESVDGELWMVHGGGFYLVEKRRPVAGKLPGILHWFKWEAALTWLSGFALLGLIYYSTRGLYLVDPLVSGISPGAASGLGVGALIVSWAVYDLIWKSPLGQRIVPATVISLVLAGGLAFLLCKTLSGRAAYIHFGAALGTIMVANVWMRILPAQKRMVAATEQGVEPDLAERERAKLRSVHNTYITFPVLFTMVSSHFPGTYGNELSWLILWLFFAFGAGARYVMLAVGGRRALAAAATAAALVGIVLLTLPPTFRDLGAVGTVSKGEEVGFQEAKAIITARCVSCHSDEPRDDTFGAAPGGVSLDTDAEILRWAGRIYYRSVITKTMPLGNITRMTSEEREKLGRWFRSGSAE
jgi:uncharacterized membrane protein